MSRSPYADMHVLVRSCGANEWEAIIRLEGEGQRGPALARSSDRVLVVAKAKAFASWFGVEIEIGREAAHEHDHA